MARRWARRFDGTQHVQRPVEKVEITKKLKTAYDTLIEALRDFKSDPDPVTYKKVYTAHGKVEDLLDE